MLFGRQIDCSEEQCENDPAEIIVSRDPDSNVKHESDLQPEKHPHPKILTDDGIQVDRRDEHEKNAVAPIRSRCDTGANVMAESN
jgi:hypothetical protein